MVQHADLDHTGLTGVPSANPQFTTIELGHATDTTIARASAGNLTVEGNALYRAGGTDVAVADGGTGASTATAGFDALSPMTTAGDLIIGGASGTRVRLAAGTATHVLTSNGAGAAPSWQAGAGGGSLTSTGVTLGADVALAASGGTYTDILSLGSLATGTWLITGSFLCATTGGAVAHALLKLWDGTTVYASSDTVIPTGPGYAAQIPIVALIVLGGAATIKVSGAYNNAAVSAYAATLVDGNIKASTLVGVKIA